MLWLQYYSVAIVAIQNAIVAIQGALVDLIRYLEPFAEAFHETFRLAKIAVVIPKNSASCETSFSKIKFTKSYLCNSMADRRLSNLQGSIYRGEGEFDLPSSIFQPPSKF